MWADKLTLAANLRPALDAAVRNLQSLNAADPSPAHLIHLFDILEQNRATALSDALRQQRGLALAGIPDSLLAREESLRREAAALDNDLKKKELKRDTVIAELQAASFRASMAYAEMLTRLKKQYPRFSQYTQAEQAAGIKEIALALPDTAALLSWHDAGDRYLCAVLQRGELFLHEVRRDTAFDHALARFVALLSDKAAQERDPAAYFRAAHFFGEKLLPPAVLSTAKSLIVIPDGLLCRLPFEALLTRPHSGGGYADAPYLLRSHTVRYAWSGTLLVQYAPQTTGKGLLQLAPFASSARDGLSPLPNSLRDKPDGLSADVLQGADATTGLFLQKAPAYAALHLSTHASAGGRAVPGIEFADRTLSQSEIYAQRFRASLVSLSACETAAGSFAQSEGVLSLARAFAYAGAQSLVASHWSVNERSTADLFSAFYENLQRSLPKAEALRQAKLRYLASAELEARKLPFHWAAFTLTGVDGEVQLERGGQWQRWALAALLMTLALAGFRRFSRRKNR
jgi:CHAT domain-containing protein